MYLKNNNNNNNKKPKTGIFSFIPKAVSYFEKL